MANYDEFQAELDRLAEEEKRALLKTLRGKQPVAQLGTWLIGGPDAGTGWANAEGRREVENVSRRRQDVSRREQEALNSIINNPSPTAQDLMRHPATRATGMTVLQDTIKKKQTQDTLDKIRQQYMGGGQGGALPQATGQGPAGVPPMQMIDAMMQSGDPTLVKQAETLYKRYYEGHDPGKVARMGPNGEMYTAPGSLDVLGGVERTKSIGGTFGKEMREERDAAGNILPPRSLASALGYANGGNAVPNTPVPTAPGSMPTQPQRPVSGPVSAPPPGAIPPEAATNLLRMLTAPGTPPQMQIQLARKLDEGGWGFDTQSGQLFPKAGGQPPQQAPQQAQMGTAAPGPVPGRGYNPESMKLNLQANKELQDAAANVPNTLKSLESLKSTSEQIPSGPRGVLKNAMNVAEGFLTGQEPKELGDTQVWLSKVKQAAYPLMRPTFGAQFTAKEGEQYMETWGNLSTTKAGRQEILRWIEAQSKDLNDRAKWMNEAVQVGADPYAYISQMRARASGNPNQPGAAASAPTPGKVLPAATKAAPQPQSEAGVLDFLGKVFNPVSQEAQDVGRNLVALPGALASAGGREAAGDVYKNLKTGARQLAGDFIPGVSPADRSGTDAEAQRQAARSAQDPNYQKAKIFHDIFNPTALIGGTATSIPKVALAVGAQSALRPQESLAKQLEEGVVGTAVGATTAGAAKFLPATQRAGGNTELEAQARRMGVSPTNAQLNPSDLVSRIGGDAADRASHLTQIKQITEGLLKETGSKSKVISDEVLSKRSAELSKGFDDMFAKTQKGLISSADYKALQDAITKNPQIEKLVASGEAPTLAAVRQAMEDASKKGVVAVKVPLDKLHQAWQEIGAAAGHRGREAGALREVLEPIIKRGLEKSGKPADGWDTLRDQWGALQDLKKVWNEGVGRGKGEAVEFLRPTAIEQYAKELPGGSPIKDAASLTHGYGIRDFGEQAVDTPMFNITSPGTYKSLVEVVPDPILRFLNKSVANGDPGAKKLIELLRAGISRGPGEVVNE